MYHLINGLPLKYQKQVKRKLFQAISAEGEDETEVDQYLLIKIQSLFINNPF